MIGNVSVTAMASILPDTVDEKGYYSPGDKKGGKLNRDYLNKVLGKRYLKKIDVSVAASVILSQRILQMQQLTEQEKEKTGLMLGNALGEWGYVEKQLSVLYKEKDLEVISPYVATAWFPTAAQGEISIALGILGHSKTVSCGELSGGTALKCAFEAIEEGKIHFAITGGFESPNNKFVNSLFSGKLIDGSSLFFLEDTQVAIKKDQPILFRITQIEQFRSVDRLLHALKDIGDYFMIDSQNKDPALEKFFRDKNKIKLELKLQETLFSLRIPIAINQLYKRVILLEQSVTAVFNNNGQYVALTMEA